jgi:hypothetical protein
METLPYICGMENNNTTTMTKKTKNLLCSLETQFSNDDLSYTFVKCDCCDTFTALFKIEDREFTIEVNELIDYLDVIEMFEFITGDPLIYITNQLNGVKWKDSKKMAKKIFNEMV